MVIGSPITAGIQIGNLVLLGLWLVLSLLALFGLRSKRSLGPGSQAAWTVIVLLIPIFGAVASLIILTAEPKQP